MDDFEHNIIASHGAYGREWLDSLPNLTKELAQRWDLKDLHPAKNLSFNYLVVATRGNEPVILKIGIDANAIKQEALALGAFAGYGVISLLEHEQKALLLQRAVPGVSLQDSFAIDSLKPLEIASDLLEKLHNAPIPQQHFFPSLEDLLITLDQHWDVPHGYLAVARQLKRKLLADLQKPVLLHGDLHQDNILSHRGSWLIIDPKGVIGDPIFDQIGSLIREPLKTLLQHKDALQIITQRVDFIAQRFQIDRAKIIDWTFMHAVLACCWCLEDQHDASQMLQFIELMQQLRRAV